MIDFLLGLFVCQPFASFGLVSYYAIQVKALSIIIMKVYIERNNMKLELILYDSITNVFGYQTTSLGMA